MTITEIKSMMSACVVELVDEETGEIVGREIDEEMFKQLQLALNDKIDGLCSWIKDLDNSANNIATEIKRLQERKKSTENLKERLKNLIVYATEGENKRTDFYTVSIKKGLFVDSYDRAKIPDEYKRERITLEPDTAKIKQAVESGKIIPGVKMKAYSVTVR